MKLLISAYACAPGRGSEHAVGWNWVTQAQRLGHEVWVLASTSHRDAILAACHAAPDLAGINWHFPAIPGWTLQQGREPAWERTYNLLWQRAALRRARTLHREIRFDVVHHLTWGGIRAPTFLGGLGVPLVIGPIGGGETSPRTLRDGFHAKARITEWLRDLSTATIAVNPLVRGGLVAAAAIFVKTPDTRAVLTVAMQAKAIVFNELGLAPSDIDQPRPARHPSPPRLLFAGRLLYWKGAHIALHAFAELSRLRPDARLTIVGRGPEQSRLRSAAGTPQLRSRVDFVPWLPQPELFALYKSHDLLVFPSLHDSSGNVVLEALSRGLPVVCLDVGGPATIVTDACGGVVSTAGRDTAAVASAMAREIAALLDAPERLAALSRGAVARAQDFLQAERVARFYDAVRARTGRAGVVAPRAPRWAASSDAAQHRTR